MVRKPGENHAGTSWKTCGKWRFSEGRSAISPRYRANGQRPQGRSRQLLTSTDACRLERRVARRFGNRAPFERASSPDARHRRADLHRLELPEEFVRCARHMPHDGASGVKMVIGPRTDRRLNRLVTHARKKVQSCSVRVVCSKPVDGSLMLTLVVFRRLAPLDC